MLENLASAIGCSPHVGDGVGDVSGMRVHGDLRSGLRPHLKETDLVVLEHDFVRISGHLGRVRAGRGFLPRRLLHFDHKREGLRAEELHRVFLRFAPLGSIGLDFPLRRLPVSTRELRFAQGEKVRQVRRVGVERHFVTRLAPHFGDPYPFIVQSDFAKVRGHRHHILGVDQECEAAADGN